MSCTLYGECNFCSVCFCVIYFSSSTWSFISIGHDLEFLGGSRPGMSTQLEFYAYSLNLNVLVLDTITAVMVSVSICCLIAVPHLSTRGSFIIIEV